METNTFWSDHVQGMLTLDLSREARFRDDRKDFLLRLLRLQPGMTVLDVGCGPGALTRKLGHWLGPSSQVIGVDRDSAFIEYARKKAGESGLSNVRFEQGDALALPLADGSVDACTSHSVIEHVPNTQFLLEQRRVCRAGGVVSVMDVSGCRAICSNAGFPSQRSEREQSLANRLLQSSDKDAALGQVGAHQPDLAGFPRLLEELEFSDLQVDAIALPVVPDDARHDPGQRRALIESDWRAEVEQLALCLRSHPSALSAEESRELRGMVDERFRKRLSMMERGQPLWDYHISIVVIFSGVA